MEWNTYCGTCQIKSTRLTEQRHTQAGLRIFETAVSDTSEVLGDKQKSIGQIVSFSKDIAKKC